MDYSLRGKCKEMSMALCKKDSSLTLTRGWYYEPMWNREEQHWWCKDTKGNIIDPTKGQFPSNGIEEFYREFDGIVECDECGKKLKEEDAMFDSRYAFCRGTRCYPKFIGIDEYMGDENV